MRKLSRTRLREDRNGNSGVDREDRPRGIPGATVTARPNPDLDLSILLLQHRGRPTVTASDTADFETIPTDREKTEAKKTVSLSDGTRITFATVE